MARHLQLRLKYVPQDGNRYLVTSNGRPIVRLETQDEGDHVTLTDVASESLLGTFTKDQRKRAYLLLLYKYDTSTPYRKDIRDAFNASLVQVGLSTEPTLYRDKGYIVGYSKDKRGLSNIDDPHVVLRQCPFGFMCETVYWGITWGPYGFSGKEQKRLVFEIKDFFYSRGYAYGPRKQVNPTQSLHTDFPQ